MNTTNSWETTYGTVTEAQIDELRAEAGESGDLDMVQVCQTAGAGDYPSLCRVAKVLSEARANARLIYLMATDPSEGEWD